MSAVTDDVLLARQQTQVSALPQFVYEDKIRVTSPNINAQSLPTKAQLASGGVAIYFCKMETTFMPFMFGSFRGERD